MRRALAATSSTAAIAVARRTLPAAVVARRVAVATRLALLGLATATALLRRQRDPLALVVDLEDADGELLADLDDLARVLHELLGELRDVDQAVVVDADIDERTERGDVGDQALEHHADLEILHRGHVVAELRRRELGAWIAARLGELGDDVAQRWLADVRGDVLREVDAIDQLLVADQLRQLDAEIPRDRLDQRVALGVDRRVVERIRRAGDPQEARGLLERLGPQARDLHQLRARAKRAVRVAVDHDLLGERLADTGHVAEQLGARRVELDADVVDAVLDHVAQALGEQRLVHVVLVLAHADRLRLDLDQLGEWILQPPGDRDRAADRQIELGELLARQIRRRVHARPGLVDLDDERRAGRQRRIALAGRQLAGAQPALGQRALDEALGLAAAGAIADGDRARRELPHERDEVVLGLGHLGVALRDVDRDRAEELAGRVDRRALAAGAQPRIDADHRRRAERRRQHEVAQVAGEDIDSRAVGPLLELGAHVVLDAGRQQALERVGHRELQLGGPRRRLVELGEPQDAGLDPRAIDDDVGAQHALGLAAADREEAMRRDRPHRLLELVVLLELGRLAVLAGDDLRGELAVLGVLAAGQRADLGGIGDDLGDDIARPGQRVVGGRDLLADEPGRGGPRIALGALRQDVLRERPQALVARDRRPGLAARPVRRVQILELGLGLGRAQLGLELRRQLALLGDRREDRGPAGLELDDVRPLLLDRADLDLVEPTGALLAVAGDERDRVALVEHRHHRRDGARREPERARHGRHRVEVGRRSRRRGRFWGRVVAHWVSDRTHLADERQVVRYPP